MVTAQAIQVQIQKEQKLQSLYRVVNSSIEKLGLESNSQHQLEIMQVESNINSLIDSFVKNMQISPFNLSKILIPIINKILTAQTEESVKNISLMFKESQTTMNDHLLNLYRLCQIKLIRTALINIQGALEIECILEAKAPEYELKKQQILWQFHSSKGAADPQYHMANQKLLEIEAKMKEVAKETEKVIFFCSKYRVSA